MVILSSSLQTVEPTIAREHMRNNEEVRKLLGNRGIVPEQLPPADLLISDLSRLIPTWTPLYKRIR